MMTRQTLARPGGCLVPWPRPRARSRTTPRAPERRQSVCTSAAPVGVTLGWGKFRSSSARPSRQASTQGAGPGWANPSSKTSAVETVTRLHVMRPGSMAVTNAHTPTTSQRTSSAGRPANLCASRDSPRTFARDCNSRRTERWTSALATGESLESRRNAKISAPVAVSFSNHRAMRPGTACTGGGLPRSLPGPCRISASASSSSLLAAAIVTSAALGTKR